MKTKFTAISAASHTTINETISTSFSSTFIIANDFVDCMKKEA
jgi:hypothetical protein